MTTLLLAGLIPSVWQGLASFVVLFVAFTAQLLLLPRTPAARWWTAKLPLGLRLAIAAAVAWLVAWQIGRTAYQTTFGITVITAKDFAPLLYGRGGDRVHGRASPGGATRCAGPGARTGRRCRMIRRIAVTTAVVVLVLVTTEQPAAAHNCGSLSDCLPSGKAILIALAAVLIIGGVVAIGFGGAALLAALAGSGGGLALAGGGVVASAGAISVATAAEIAAAGALATTAGVMMANAAESGDRGGGSRGDGGSAGPSGPEATASGWTIRASFIARIAGCRARTAELDKERAGGARRRPADQHHQPERRTDPSRRARSASGPHRRGGTLPAPDREDSQWNVG